MKKLKSIEDLTAFRKRLSKEGVLAPGKKRIRVCAGTACRANRSLQLVDKLHEEAKRSHTDVEIITTGCQGLCQMGPVMTIEPQEFFHHKVHPERAEDIMTRTVRGEKPLWDLLYRRSIGQKPAYLIKDVPFYRKQVRVSLRNNGRIDPTNIMHYIAVGGYKALEKALSGMTPGQVLEEVKKSHLRGRGGAGFPAGVKWEHTRKAPGAVKIVIANGDEGDPGAFMDRSIMEGDPHSLLEGMLLCAYAIGARYGIIYVRHEYPLAVKHLQIAINQAEEMGFLGKNILGKGFDFSVQIREGAGAFVCGEATALVASIEGERGFPHPRPPRVSEPGGGPWGYPANLNNIETYACVPPIVENGADWFLGIGTESSPGTKVFALTGKVKNTGLVEVPMGMTLREIIFDIGGGIIGNKKFKAVQTGGPSGGCIPEQHLDLPIDFDSLSKVGSIMGSGGMVVMDEDNCIVDVAKFFLSFCQAESCGKCYPCRIGTYQMLQILDKITSGNGEEGDIERLEKLGQYVKKASLCGLGRSAPNPILTTIKYFRDEYEEHVKDKYCRAFVCQGLGMVSLNSDVCYQCKRCMDICPYEAIKESEEGIFYVDQVLCQRCKACFSVCPLGAIEIKEPPVLVIDKETCYFCGNCKNVCRVNAIKQTSTGYMIDPETCKRCGDCYKVCPMGAIRYEKVGKVLRGAPVEPVAVTGETEEKTGEITIEDIRKDAESMACHVQKALRFVEEFVAGPMCGKCYPCSLGTEEAKTILLRLSQHRENAGEQDIEALRRIGTKMTEGSYCKKGRDTGRFILDALAASEEEFRLHLMGICPKKECVSMMEYVINPDLCIACGKCSTACKYNAVAGEIREPHQGVREPFVIKQKECVRCGECLKVCPTGAVEVITAIREEPVTEKELVSES
jgi:NADH:ubiquinone oxidoreductase subunit F (NADH-binding)/NAD-dependent dihydropyrimidine dehydrogenase PreA subunit/(2Fe-2S) ferredoxin